MSLQRENEVANLIGSHAYFNIIFSSSAALCYGFNCCLFYAALRASSKHNTKFLLPLTCFTFMMNSGLFVEWIAYPLIRFAWARDAVTQSMPSPEDRLRASYAADNGWFAYAVICEIVNFLISDAVVIWRTTALWPQSRLLKAGLYFLFLGDLGVSLYESVVCITTLVRSGGTDTSSWSTLDSIRILVSFGVNMIATLLVAIMAWQYRRTMRLGFSKTTTKQSFVNRVLTLLVECSLLFCAVQLAYAVYDVVLVQRSDDLPLMSPQSLLGAAIQPFFSFFAGMYPSIVIIIMPRNQSILETSSFLAISVHNSGDNDLEQQRSKAFSALRFAAVQETTDQLSLTIQSSREAIVPIGKQDETNESTSNTLIPGEDNKR